MGGIGDRRHRHLGPGRRPRGKRSTPCRTRHHGGGGRRGSPRPPEPNGSEPSNGPGRPQAFGSTATGKFITVIWEEVFDDPRTIHPVTAYEVPPPQGRKR